MIETKSNAQYDELCSITTTLAREHHLSRPGAFKAACAQRPDLAAAAVYPDGKPVMPGSKAAAGKTTQASTSAGGARPWDEVFRALGISTKSAAAKAEGCRQ